MNSLIRSDIDRAFSIAPDLSQGQIKEIERHGVKLSLEPGQYVCWEGDTCGHLPFVINGLVRVYKVGENGRELTLYRIHPGESCILTVSCILSAKEFPAHAVVEESVQAIGIPAGIIADWTDKYEVWRRFAFGMMSSRLDSIIELVDSVTFKRLDIRLSEYLLANSTDDKPLKRTHQDIAYELGSAREVVSRVLKDFEHRELISLERGIIHILDHQSLLNITKN
ncbi:MAG: Crp/Fnr family transcriptional regulator [FCB group bacterium]|nr:Crp/Fnr family transcriptional regulator [FCB group bacterium]MBL7120351.1 Crp/Fnr family transcriptional regulator [Candidatus Neomarinimicrobiota bacterium]